MASTNLQLLKYAVNEISFALNENYDFSKKQSIKLNQNFTRSIKKINEDVCDVSLMFVISDSDDYPAPFTMKVTITGKFKLKDWESKDNIDFIKTNAVAIVYPFLRSLVATITSNANIPSYILPVFNIAAFFEKEDKKDD